MQWTNFLGSITLQKAVHKRIQENTIAVGLNYDCITGSSRRKKYNLAELHTLYSACKIAHILRIWNTAYNFTTRYSGIVYDPNTTNTSKRVYLGQKSDKTTVLAVHYLGGKLLCVICKALGSRYCENNWITADTNDFLMKLAAKWNFSRIYVVFCF